MDDGTRAFLSTPLAASRGVPLRVAVYTRIAEAIRSHRLPPGTLIPGETELGALLGVSRTVVREALMLLEEDGLVRARRGIGRFVGERPPAVGIEKLRPLELLLAAQGAAGASGAPGASGASGASVTVRRTEVTLQETAAPFIAEGLGMSTDEPTWFRECVMSIDGRPVALLQEHLPAGTRLAGFGGPIDEAVRRGGDASASLLATLLGLAADRITSADAEIAVGMPGGVRARLLGTRAGAPVLVITQSVRLDDRPFYLAKQLVTDRVGHLSVRQTTP
jgi:GntR family transcriptional regulator